MTGRDTIMESHAYPSDSNRVYPLHSSKSELSFPPAHERLFDNTDVWVGASIMLHSHLYNEHYQLMGPI